MAKAPKLADLMEQESTGTVDRPKPLPTGSYVARIVGQVERGESEQKGTPFIRFQGEIVDARDDVDEDELNEWKEREDGSERTLQGTAVPKSGLTFYKTPDALWRMDKFFQDCGILVKGKTRNDMAEDAIGQEFVVHIGHQNSRNEDDVVYAIVKGTSAVDA